MAVLIACVFPNHEQLSPASDYVILCLLALPPGAMKMHTVLYLSCLLQVSACAIVLSLLLLNNGC
jgi:hypothetical protein